KPAQNACGAVKRSGTTIFIGYSESLRMLNRAQSRLHGLISIALRRPAVRAPALQRAVLVLVESFRLEACFSA
ncbi:hypothetical protein AB4Y32_29145, partial [Paraburkholderia phymatum]